MTREQRLAKNPRLLFWTKAFVELKMLNAIVVLFYLARGVTMEQVFYLSMVWSVGTLLFEIPTGYLADKIGRKRALCLGVLTVVASQLLSFSAQGFFDFAIIFLVMSLADSLFSGTEEALVYDSLKEIGREKETTKFYGQLSSARHITKIVFPTLGAFIASDLLEWQFDIVIAINAVLAFVAFIFLLRVVEPKHEMSLEDEESGVYLQSLKTIWTQPFLFRASMNKILIIIASIIGWRVYQPYLTDLGVSVFALGIFYVFLHVGGFGAKWFAHVIEKRVQPLRLLTWTAIIALVTSLISIFTSIPWIVFVSTLLLLETTNAREPIFSAAMNKLIHSKSRATTLSNLNVFKAVIDIPLLLLCGFLAGFGPEQPLWICAGLALAVLVIFPIKPHHIK